MTKAMANKYFNAVIENIHSADDALKVRDLIEWIYNHTETTKSEDKKSRQTITKNKSDKIEANTDNEADNEVAEATNVEIENTDKAEEETETTGGLFDDDDDDSYTITATPIMTEPTVVSPTITAQPVVRKIPAKDTAIINNEMAASEADKETVTDKELRDLREKEIESFMPPLPEVPEERRKSLEPPAKREAPTDEKIEKLMEEGHKVMSEPAWQTFEATYRRGYDYERLRNMWAYFHETQPADWGELPKEAA